MTPDQGVQCLQTLLEDSREMCAGLAAERNALKAKCEMLEQVVKQLRAVLSDIRENNMGITYLTP